MYHLSDYADRLGPLPVWAVYAFENNMQEYKRLLKKDNLPLEQIAKRILELEALYEDFNLLDLTSQSKNKTFMSEHCEGPLHPFLNLS